MKTYKSKAVVVGAGIIGVTTAYTLAKKGYEVVVIDSLEDVALNTSFANAGQLSYGYALPWASPGMIQKALKWMLIENSPFKLSIDYPNLGSQIDWLLKMSRNCNENSYALNKAAMLKISSLSKQCMHSIVKSENIEFDYETKGTLQLFRTDAQLQNAIHNEAPLLNGSGVNTSILTAKEDILQLEPGLHQNISKIKGAMHIVDDETGNCQLFTKKLAHICEKVYGVKFLFNTLVTELVSFNRKASHLLVKKTDAIENDLQKIEADFYVFCQGVSATKIQGIQKYSVYPVKGFSLTFSAEALAPTSTVMDESNKIAITRLGPNVRMGGMAAVCGFDLSKPQSRLDFFKSVYGDLFQPVKSDVEYWTGLRPTTPTGVPYIENLKNADNLSLENAFLNCGHGTLGWTMAAGSAAIVSELIEN